MPHLIICFGSMRTLADFACNQTLELPTFEDDLLDEVHLLGFVFAFQTACPKTSRVTLTSVDWSLFFFLLELKGGLGCHEDNKLAL